MQVAGKTGTAQATLDGRKDNVAWFACFAPYDHPKYTVVVMVQGSEGHGGSVAAPIADRILERTLAMEDGRFDPQLAWLAPAHKANPFQQVVTVDYKDKPNLPDSDEEGGNDNDPATAAPAQMAASSASPDVEPEADAAGKVQKKAPKPVVVAAPPPKKPSFFERLFGVRPKPAPAPTPPPKQPQQRPVRR